MKKIEIEFYFKGRNHHAIIRSGEKGTGKEYRITVLDWELERMLYGNEVISEADGVLQANLLPENKEQTELKGAIAAGLSRHLKVPCFAGDLCLATESVEGWEGLHPIPRHRVHLPYGSE